MRSARNGSWQ